VSYPCREDVRGCGQAVVGNPISGLRLAFGVAVGIRSRAYPKRRPRCRELTSYTRPKVLAEGDRDPLRYKRLGMKVLLRTTDFGRAGIVTSEGGDQHYGGHAAPRKDHPRIGSTSGSERCSLWRSRCSGAIVRTGRRVVIYNSGRADYASKDQTGIEANHGPTPGAQIGTGAIAKSEPRRVRQYMARQRRLRRD
jgi:hypothetical protein